VETELPEDDLFAGIRARRPSHHEPAR
jgi:hypothetical protein